MHLTTVKTYKKNINKKGKKAMKLTKKFASMLLALIMMLSLVTTAFAADTYEIVVNNATTGHTYEAYQIFTGDLQDDGTLANITWGSSVANADALGTAASISKRLETTYIGADKLSLDDFIAMLNLGNPVASSSDNSSGSYTMSGLVAGYYLVKDMDDSLSGNDAYTEYMIKVVEDVSTTPKADVPEVEKKVKDLNDSTNELSGWQDSADYDLNDNVPFQLKATLANNVSAYDTYKVIFHDTMAAGLTYNYDAKVLVDGDDMTASFTINCTGESLTISCADVKALGAGNSSEIIVTYTAKLNENAVMGSAGNKNTVYLEFSNDPNWDEGGENEPTGETPDDTVIVFTYQLSVDKVDANGKELKGAGFTLYKKDSSGVYVQIGQEPTGPEMTTFVWERLDDGDYKLVETTTPAGYNPIDPIEFTITAEHDVLSDDPALTSLSGGVLGTGEVSTGVVDTEVVNKQGALLPETGGIGTTIFYAIGGVLVLAAVVLLVSKKRMKDAE